MSPARTCSLYPAQDPVRLVTSYLVSPVVLAAVRSVLALFATATLIGSIIEAASNNVGDGGVYWIFFFTNLSYTGLVAYFVSAAVHTVLYARQRRGVAPDAYPPPRSLPKHAILTKLHAMLYISVIPTHILVPVVYYALLYPSTLPAKNNLRQWIRFGTHGTDAFSILVELILSRVLVSWWGFVVFMGIGVLYMCYMWIIAAGTGFWAYAFLDWTRNSSVAIGYVAVIAGFVVCFLIVKAATYLREWLARRFGCAKKFENQDPDADADPAQAAAPPPPATNNPGQEELGMRQVDLVA